MKDVTIVVGTIGQSIMRSEDNGQTWARIGPRRGFAYEASVRCIAMQPRQPNILFAGTERGLYRSEDAGANWQYVDSALNPHYIWAIGIRSDESRQHVCRNRHADAGDALSFAGRRPDLGEAAGGSRGGVRGGRHARDSPALPSIRWNQSIFGWGSKLTARAIAAMAGKPGSWWK